MYQRQYESEYSIHKHVKVTLFRTTPMINLGYCENSLRLPLVPASNQLTAAIEHKLDEFTIIS